MVEQSGGVKRRVRVGGECEGSRMGSFGHVIRGLVWFLSGLIGYD